MPADQEQPRQACDCCRLRKVKCDRGRPCKNCDTGNLQCRYLHSIRRAGPKEGRGRRQQQLRRGLTDFGGDQLQIVASTPDVPFSPGSGAGDGRSNGPSRRYDVYPQPSPSLSQPSPTLFQSLEANVTLQPGVGSHPTPLSLDSPIQDALGNNRQLSLCLSLAAHVRLFVKFIFPIMPVIDGDELLSDLARLDELSPPRYALILAVCAATRMQLSMDQTKSGEGPGTDVPPEPRLTGAVLLSLAETSLRRFNLIDDTGLDSVVASYLVGTCYGNLNNIRHASFYLNQSISLAQSLDITRESGYRDLPDSEREKRRRIFWLLFVTERTFALQHRRPVMLRNSVTKPKVLDSEYPVVMNDFVNHIRLFESLPPSLYEWESEGDGHQRDDLELVHTISGKLCAIQADQSVIESQRFDTLVTQQWLRISMWRLALEKRPSPAYKSGRLLPPSLPMDAGKIIIPALNSVGSRSKDCHGIAMEQKLFDVGVSLTDSALIPSWSNSSLELGPRDLLFAVVGALSTSRGCQSYLLSALLKYSEHLLAFADPAAHIDFRLDVPRHTDDPNETQVAPTESTSTSPEGEESVHPLIWFAGDELSLLDLSTPGPTSLPWEDVDVFGGQVGPDIGVSP